MNAALTLPDWPVGIFDDVPAEVYHRKQLGVATSHALGAILRSPAHYLAWLAEPERETKALNFGRAAHAALLEPDVFRRTYVVEPEWGSCRANQDDGTTKEQGKANKERRDAWRAAHAGAQLVTAEDMGVILGMRDALARETDALDLLCEGRPEVTIRWTCPDTGLLCQSRLDWWADDVDTVADLKTIEDAREAERAIRNFGYRRQDAHYLDGLRECGRPGRFVFIFVEKSPPFGVRVLELDDEARAHGREQIDRAKRIMAECKASGVWPAYPSGIKKVGLERWER